MLDSGIQVGRVLRVGRRWADVEINHKVRRISTRPDLLVRAGAYIKIINAQGVALLNTDRYVPDEMH
ncbi:MAG: hypothetical protein K8S97_00830 [Anaerolineae bacterium]|nr:hypothetical protein [Anaerolineae bacterium]